MNLDHSITFSSTTTSHPFLPPHYTPPQTHIMKKPRVVHHRNNYLMVIPIYCTIAPLHATPSTHQMSLTKPLHTTPNLLAAVRFQASLNILWRSCWQYLRASPVSKCCGHSHVGEQEGRLQCCRWWVWWGCAVIGWHVLWWCHLSQQGLHHEFEHHLWLSGHHLWVLEVQQVTGGVNNHQSG